MSFDIFCGKPAPTTRHFFLLTSKSFSLTIMADAFISYSRKDQEFVKKIHQGFQKLNRDIWVDWEDIYLTENWRTSMYVGIESADNFVFIISPDSVQSKPCGEEVEHAIRLNKRLVPVMYRYASSSTVHPSLRCLNFVPFNGDETEFESSFQKLIEAIDTDLDYVKFHTRLLARAIEWDKKGRNHSYLLRGSDLDEAEDWLMEGIHKNPQPTALHREYIGESQQTEKLQQRNFLARVTFAMIVSIVLAIVAFSQWKRAESITQRQIQALSRSSELLRKSNQEFEALITALKASRQLNLKLADATIKTETEVALQGAVYNVAEKNRLKDSKFGAIAVRFSPDGQLIATANWDKKLTLWKPEGTKIKTLSQLPSLVTNITFSTDSQQVAAGLKNGTVFVWNQNGEQSHQITNLEGEVKSIYFNSQSFLIATVLNNKNKNVVKIWNVEKRLLATLSGHSGTIYSVNFSPDGRTIATASSDGTVILWNLLGQKLQTLDHQDVVYSVNFSPDSKTMITGTKQGKIFLWSADGKKIDARNVFKWNRYQKKLTQDSMQHDNEITNVTFSPDGQFIVSADSDGIVKLWTRQGMPVQTFQGNQKTVYSVAFSPNHSIIASAGEDGTVILWRRNTQQPVMLWGRNGTVNQVSFSPDGQVIATADDNGTVKLWNSDGSFQAETKYHSGRVYRVIFSPDNQLIASAGADGRVVLMDVKTGTQLATLPHPNAVNSIAFSPNSQQIVSISNDGNNCLIKVWNRDGKELTNFYDKTAVSSVTFSPDGQMIVTAGEDKTIKLWSLKGQRLNTFLTSGGNSSLPLQGTLNNIVFSSDGKIIATASVDHTVKFWNEKGQLIKILKHPASVTDITFSANNQMVATASQDKVYLWDTQGKKLQTLTGHYSNVTSVAFDRDGNRLASSDQLGRTILWDLNNLKQDQQNLLLPALMKKGCNWIQDYLQTQPVETEIKSLCQKF